MDAREPALAEQLLVIERELRILDLWGDLVPTPEALASVEPFCLDTLPFEQWLQWVFLPRMKVIIEADHPLPSVSGVKAMAEVVYCDRLSEVAGLLAALGEFDRLIAN